MVLFGKLYHLTREKFAEIRALRHESKKSEKVIIASNIEFTMPIYNPIPYQYFFNHVIFKKLRQLCEFKTKSSSVW